MKKKKTQAWKGVMKMIHFKQQTMGTEASEGDKCCYLEGLGTENHKRII